MAKKNSDLSAASTRFGGLLSNRNSEFHGSASAHNDSYKLGSGDPQADANAKAASFKKPVKMLGTGMGC